MSFAFILPFMSQAMVDRGIMNSDMNFIQLLLISQIILSVSELFINFIQSWLLLHTSGRISIALISDYINKMLNMPISFFNTKSVGDIIQRIGDHSRIQGFLAGSTIGIVFAAMSFLIFAFILGYYNLTILAVFLVGHILYVTWIVAFLRIRRDLDFKSFEKGSKNKSSTIELIEGAEEIKLSGAEQKMRNKWEFTQGEIFQLSIRKLRVSQIQTIGSFFISNITNITLSIMSAYLVINGEITLGMMMSLSFILGQLKGPISSLLGFIHSFQDAKISVERLSEIHFQKDENANLTTKDLDFRESSDIHIKNITFNYMGDKLDPILKNLSLTIPKGKITAIVGESGSGKTTIIKLLLGYFQPQRGEIFIGDHNLNDIDLKVWRENCSAILQDGTIFFESILENVAISERNIIDRNRVVDCCKKVNLHEFILSLPNKYDTKLGREGNGISQGQRQRILIARALYKNTSFLFLDEATNALDAKNEKIVIENLNSFFHNKTVVIVAHRLSTVKNADQIIVMDNGEIAEVGRHEELLQKKHVYYNLVKNQLEL